MVPETGVFNKIQEFSLLLGSLQSEAIYRSAKGKGLGGKKKNNKEDGEEKELGLLMRESCDGQWTRNEVE